jgi:hypothetical protein
VLASTSSRTLRQGLPVLPLLRVTCWPPLRVKAHAKGPPVC